MSEKTPPIFPNEASENLIRDVYFGVTTPYNLPYSVYSFNYLVLEKELLSGFTSPFKYPKKEKYSATLEKFRLNIDMFSGSKTWHETNELTANVFNADGTKKPFKEFKEIAKKINENYNQTWLKTEQNAVFAQAQSSEQWLAIEEEKSIFPLLQYVTVGDGLVRPLHQAWNGIIKPVDDPFWLTCYPINDWGCRCRVIQLEKGKPTDLDKHLKEFNEKTVLKEPIKSLENDSKVFANNPAKTGLIFTKDHPYFLVPDAFKKAQKVNFGFEPPHSDAKVK